MWFRIVLNSHDMRQIIVGGINPTPQLNVLAYSGKDVWSQLRLRDHNSQVPDRKINCGLQS